VLFVFGRAAIDVSQCSTSLADFMRSNGAEKDYLLMFDVVYAHAIGKKEKKIENRRKKTESRRR
jgi:hypothetical protein